MNLIIKEITRSDAAHIAATSHISIPIYGEMIKNTKHTDKCAAPIIKSSLLSMWTASFSSSLSGSFKDFLNIKKIINNSVKPATIVQ